VPGAPAEQRGDGPARPDGGHGLACAKRHYARSEADADAAEAAIRAAVTFSDAPVERPPLWYAIVTRDGVVRA
jgi:hypothetical protein